MQPSESTMSGSAAAGAEGVLLVSFGGPEALDEVMPFLRRVTAGRDVPDERLAVVAEHYVARGGVSPINQANRELRAALAKEFRARGRSKPVLWGNRNAEPFIADALVEADRLGLTRLRVILTSSLPGYSSCRQYRENLAAAVSASGARVHLELNELVWETDGFLQAQVSAVLDSLQADQTAARVLFVAHSIPEAMAAAAGPDGDGYVRALTEVSRRVMHEVEQRRPGAVAGWQLVWCSRSGPPNQPWLEPDVNDAIEAIAADDPTCPVVLVPIGFVSDHMEVVHDLDTEAAATAARVGLPFHRAATVGTDPRFVAALVDLTGQPPRLCATDCCRNLRAPDTPAACGAPVIGVGLQ